MKKTLAILLMLLVGAVSVTAAPLSQKQKQQVIAQINKAAAGLKSMNCTFTQTKHLSMLNDKMVSQGRMLYKQANRLRWEYTSPYKYVFILNGSKVYIGNKSRKDVIDTNTNKIFKEVARIMMSTVTGQALSATSDFTHDVADKGQFWQVTLVPKKKDMRKMFSKIILSFRKSDCMIAEVDMYENNRDRTNIRMTNTKPNSAVNESSFSIPK